MEANENDDRYHQRAEVYQGCIAIRLLHSPHGVPSSKMITASVDNKQTTKRLSHFYGSQTFEMSVYCL